LSKNAVSNETCEIKSREFCSKYTIYYLQYVRVAAILAVVCPSLN